MKFIVADDTIENLTAAKEAAKNFPEHEFVFTNSAVEAFKLLPDADGVVTDLFFPPEGHEDSHNILFVPYLRFLADTASATLGATFDQVVTEYYRGDRREAIERSAEALNVSETGSIKMPVERLLRLFEQRGDNENAEKYRARLNDLPAPQFPYGAVVMLAAKKAGKRHVLVSDIHRHAGGYGSAPDAVDAMALLITLIVKGIMTVEQATYDGRKSHTYLASDLLYGLAKSVRPAKTSPAVWNEAIRLVINGAD